VTDPMFDDKGEPRPGPPCSAALTLAGEHFACDWPTDETGNHVGWAHASRAANAIWRGAGGTP
jgi:hypothetical protein